MCAGTRERRERRERVRARAREREREILWFCTDLDPLNTVKEREERSETERQRKEVGGRERDAGAHVAALAVTESTSLVTLNPRPS